jgi:competence protein ComEC
LWCAILAAGAAKVGADARLLGARDVSRAEGHRVALSGRLTELPRPSARSYRVVLDAETVALAPASGRVQLVVPRGALADTLIGRLTYGSRLKARGVVTIPGGPRNPGEFDRGASLRLNDVRAEIVLGRSDPLEDLGVSPGSPVDRAVFPVRRSVHRMIDAYFAGEEAAFLTGLVTGERSEITPELKDAFITSGVMHIVAVSGLHVVIVTMMLSVLLGVLRVPERARLVILGLILAYYTFFTGATASVARSVLMAVVLLWAPRADRRSDIYNALAASAVVVLFFDSRQLFQPGFQLSYAAVFALVYLAPKVALVGAWLPEAVRSNRLVSSLGEAFGVSVAAGVGTIPFGAYYFGKISIVAFVANIVVVPLSNLVLCLGMLTVALGYLWPWLAGVYAEATSASTWLLLRSVELFSRVPFAAVRGSFGPWFFVAVYAVLAFVINAARRDRRARSVLAALACASVLIWWGALFPAREELSVTCIDVGQGDAILVRFPRGPTILVDAGPRSAGFDAGARTVVPFLRYSGIERLDALVITHPHGDHVGGAAAVLREIEVGEFVDAGTSLATEAYDEAHRLADSLGVAHRVVRAGERLEAGKAARCYVLAPGRDDGEPPERGDSLDNHGLNNTSVVLRLVYGQSSILLSGDAESEVEAGLARRFGAFLESDVLKAGHHGSKTSSSDVYLAAVRPRVAILSVGARNTFGHPSPEVTARLDALGVRTARTDRQGAVVLASDGRTGGWREVDWR